MTVTEKVTFQLMDASGKVVSEQTTQCIPVTDVSIASSLINMNAGGTYALKAAVSPEDATHKNLVWGSDNPGIAAVDGSGRVTAVSEGRAVITVMSASYGNKSDSCTIRVGSARRVEIIKEIEILEEEED